jgi:tetratricopeptide (TPR) repeat protein
MKTTAFLLLACAPLITIAQKEIKPSTTKSEKLLLDGKLDEAKTLIDVTVASHEFMYDKKGKHSKNAATAWYLRALIYAAIDTTSKSEYKSLDPNPYQKEVASFDSCTAIDQGKTPSFVKNVQGLPILPTQINANLAQRYLTTSLTAYSKEKDYKKAFQYMERVLYFIPSDTSMLMNAGVYLGPAAGEDDKSLVYIKRYIEGGGKNPDAYMQMINIYTINKKDNEKGLKAVQEAMKSLPHNTELPKLELNIYLSEKKYVLARKKIQDQLRSNPTKENYYLLGQLNEELGNADSAKIAYQKAVEMDPQFFDANLKLAKMYTAQARKIKNERDKLGISAQDKDKRLKLLMNLREEYKIALPYWEKCEAIRPDDETVLYNLQDIYSSLVMDEQYERVQKKIKTLGYDK